MSEGSTRPREVKLTFKQAQALEVTGAAKIVFERVGLGGAREVRVRVVLADGSELVSSLTESPPAA